MDQVREISVRIPWELDDAVAVYEAATGRDRDDVVVGALRTYLADQAERPALIAAFERAGVACPRPWVVEALVTLASAVEPADRDRLDATLRQIARFAPVELSWSDDRTYQVRMAASGFDADEAATAVAKMLRNRTEGEHQTLIAELDVLSSAPLSR